MTEPLSRASLVDVLEGRLRSDILDGAYPPGTYLPPERELAARYGVTRTSIKHSLIRLEQLGLIETRHGVGSQVRPFEESAGAEILPWLLGREGTGLLPEVFEARRLVGGLVARLAATRVKPDDALELERLLEVLRAAPDAPATQAAELDVHRALARVSGNRVFLYLANTFFNAYEPIQPALQSAFADPDATATAIAPMVRAVCDADPDAAEVAAHEYLAASEAPLLAALLPVGQDRGAT